MNEEIKRTRTWIKENFNDKNYKDWFDPDLFKDKILPILPKTIDVVYLPSSYQKGKFNCFVYALGLQNDNQFLRKESLPDLSDSINISSGNITTLLNKLEVTNKPECGDYIFYKNNDHYTHAGIFLGNEIVESKWSDGPVVRHPMFAVHPDYGTGVSFYKKISSSEIKQLLIS